MKMDLKTCRICCNAEGIANIFDENFEPLISSKIMYCCAKLSITEGDGLPSLICKLCEEELSAAYRFVLKCETGDQKLRSQAVPNEQIQVIPVKPKVEIKLEDSDHDDHLEDSVYNLDLKKDLEISPEQKRSKRPYKKRVKYKDASTKCSVCGLKAGSRSALVVHQRRHTSETPYPCPNCEKKYKDQGSLKRHIERHHLEGKRARNFVCEHCGKSFFSKNDVKIHMRTHTGETPYHCPECPMKFTQISALLRHKRRHTGVKSYVCATCPKKFCTKEELKLHHMVHSNEKKYVCLICNVPCKYLNSLKKHMLLHSKPNSFICNYCGRTFNQKGNLKSHIDRQHSEKSGYCNICAKNMSNIEVHMWRHTGQRPLKCELCSSSFYELKSLTRHVNYRHKNPDKFKCMYDGCTMTFPSMPMLEFHTAKIHKTGIPYPCDRCSRGFYRKNDLARHKIGTHKERLID